jgi:replicative DNA helicase
MPSLSDRIMGLPLGKMTVVGARTSMGKTAFAMQMMIDLLNIGAPILYLGFEMKPTELMDRLFCNLYKIDNYELARGAIHKHTKESEEFINDWQEKVTLVFADDFAKDWRELDDFLSTLKVKPLVIIVDFVQAIEHDHANDKKFIDDYIRHFRMMCIRENFAGVIVSQVNRSNQEGKDKSPQLHQLKGSGFLEEHADLVLLLDWISRGKADESEFKVNVAKNRNGRTGYVKLKYYPQYYRFEEWKEPMKTYKKVEAQVDWHN